MKKRKNSCVYFERKKSNEMRKGKVNSVQSEDEQEEEEEEEEEEEDNEIRAQVDVLNLTANYK